MKHRISCTVFAWIFLAALCCGAAFAADDRPAGWGEPLAVPETENFFRITPDLYRAAQPSSAGMKAYEAFGIKTVINLRNHHTDDDEAKGTKLILVHLPTSTTGVTNDVYMATVLQAIRDAEKPVLVHCMHGADRTGLVIALYRMAEQGWTREEALREMREGGYGFHSVWTHIPRYLEKVDAAAIKAQLR
ncbi:MAG: hypothetical protein DELT_01242 [Desulfovibrio sp.]